MQGKLSRNDMRNIQGGYSKLYCFTKHFRVVIFGVVVQEGMDYEKCRAMHD